MVCLAPKLGSSSSSVQVESPGESIVSLATKTALVKKRRQLLFVFV
jgi:hypothetical protein